VERGSVFEVAFGCELKRSLLRLIKTSPVFNQFSARRAHRGVFVHRVAVRDYDGYCNPGARASERQRLAMIAARSGDNSSHL
jgi:hypothetical protein